MESCHIAVSETSVFKVAVCQRSLLGCCTVDAGFKSSLVLIVVIFRYFKGARYMWVGQICDFQQIFHYKVGSEVALL